MGIPVRVPALSRRIGIPAVVGLLLSGVVIGPHVLGLFAERHPVMDFLAELGKLLLMFSAGMEIDLALFRQARGRSIIFGLLTTLLPLLLGTIVGLWSRASIRLSRGIRFLTRFAYPSGDVDHSPTWGNPA